MSTPFNSGSNDPGAVNIPFELEAIVGGTFVPVAKLYFGALGAVGVPVSASNPLPVDVITMPQVTIAGGSVSVDGSSVSVTGSVSISNSITIANGSGVNAVNIQDGGNVITVDGTVTVTQGTASNLNAQVVGTAAADAASAGNPVQIGCRASTAIPTAMSADGDVVRLWASRNGAMNVIIRDSVGDSCMDDGSNSLNVSALSVVPGTGATNLGKAEDSVHVTADVGVMALAVRRDTPIVGNTTTGDYIALTTDKFGQLRTVDALSNPGTVDTFGHIITGQRNNQIDIQFYRGTPASLVTVTTTGSGSASASGGGAVFATGATATSSAKGVTAGTVYYSSGGEVFAQFTAAFPTVGQASSFMRIGLFDDNNGVFIGYEGATFGITTRKAAADTSVAKASFNVDALTGAAGSLFTRDGSPEAINLTFANVYRVRFGWLGEAPIVFEVLSPDGNWVVFHIVKQPNTSAAASINNPELPITCHVAKTSGATDYSIVTYCWGAGCTIAQRRANDPLTVSTIMPATRAVIAGETSAGGGSLVNVKVDPSGALVTATTLSAGSLYIGNVRITDGTNDVTLLNLTNSKPVPAAIVDGSGNQITSFGGGTQYAEAATSATDPTGTVPIMLAIGSVASQVSAGQNVAQRATVYGAAFCQIVSSSGSFIDTFGGGTEYTEDAAAAADPVGGVQILVRKDTPAAITGTDGDNVAQRGSNFGAGYAHILTSAGAIVDSFGGGSSSEGPIRLTGQLTRSSTVTAYVAGDAVTDGNIQSIANATAVSGGFLEIRDVRIVSSIKGSPLPYFNLWILSATYTAQTDYDPVTLTDAENLTVEAIIPVNQQNSATNTASVEAHGLSNLVKLSGTTLYYILEITNAYTPGDAETLDVIINARRVV